MRRNGRLYESWSARRGHRTPADLYHCGLMLRLEGVTYAVEMGPVWNVPAADRGVLVEGPVGSKWLGRFRAFRYEVRCWPGGSIPDIAQAVDSPLRTTDEAPKVAAVLNVLREVPALTWGRDELGAGEMWNSNSVVAWALARTGHDMDSISPPSGGRAPGWGAGLVLADSRGCRHGVSWVCPRRPDRASAGAPCGGLCGAWHGGCPSSFNAHPGRTSRRLLPKADRRGVRVRWLCRRWNRLRRARPPCGEWRRESPRECP